MNTSIESKSEKGRERDARPLTLWVVAGAMLAAGGWLLQPVAASRHVAQPQAGVAAPFGATGEVDQSHLSSIVVLDHSIAARDGVVDESDAPGASIAAYGP